MVINEPTCQMQVNEIQNKQAGAELGQAQPYLGLRYRQAGIAAVKRQTVVEKRLKLVIFSMSRTESDVQD